MFTSHFTNNQSVLVQAHVTKSSVRRPPACGHESSYVYENGFRFLHSAPGNYSRNLVKDFKESFEDGLLALSYHTVVTAIHHNSACSFVERVIYAQQKGSFNFINVFSSKRDIERMLSTESATIARAATMLQVTEISALRTYQHSRTVGGSFAALIAVRLGFVCTGTKSVTNLDFVHRILRRASGSECKANQIAAPYTAYAMYRTVNIPVDKLKKIKNQMEMRFEKSKTIPVGPSLSLPETSAGPFEFHLAEYYACKCLRLVEGRNGDAKKKWDALECNVQRVRRGEITVYDVISDPSYNCWVYSIHYTFYMAVSNYVKANQRWNAMLPFCFDSGSASSGDNAWKTSHSSGSHIVIHTNAPKYEQTSRMIHIMYTFLVRVQKVISPQFMGVFGYNRRFVNTIIMRCKTIARESGDELSALMLGFLVPCVMTPDVHVDIDVGCRGFQSDNLYVKMSDPDFGELKKRFKHIIPSRHTGTIDRATLMDPAYTF